MSRFYQRPENALKRANGEFFLLKLTKLIVKKVKWSEHGRRGEDSFYDWKGAYGGCHLAWAFY